MGHSEASLYRYASIGWPLTYGSFGKFTSRGVMSPGKVLTLVRDAKVLARPRERAEPIDVVAEVTGVCSIGKVDRDGEIFDEESELKDCEREEIGTIKVLRLESVDLGSGSGSGSGFDLIFTSSSSGISSGAGIGRPLAAATNWFSVQDSEKSFRPLQKGAIRRSSCWAWN